MRTNIIIDDDLLAEAMVVSGLRTKRAAVEEALKTYVRHHRQREAIEKLHGIGWEGDLEETRGERFPDWVR